MFRVRMNSVFVAINCYFDRCLICKLFIHQFFVKMKVLVHFCDSQKSKLYHKWIMFGTLTQIINQLLIKRPFNFSSFFSLWVVELLV